MNCQNCQAPIPPNIAFCPECGTRVVQTAPPLRVLQDRYELRRKLGQGGMGSVYLASDRRLATVQWAVKEMSDDAITGPLERQQADAAFRHEAELLARLAHPNLPRVTDHFQQEGKNYLVMEFVPGETMLSYVQRSGLPRLLPEVLGWANQLCDVLSYLHAQSPPVIFRDLKPANVMITPEGALKLIDFGIARLFKPGQSKDTQAFGTMGYSAPEQYGRGQTDARSDVYSLGVLLHQLLTGYDPSSTPFRLPPADQLNPAVPPQLAQVLARATDADPERRFATIDELRRALLGTGNLVQRQAQDQQAAALGPTIGLNSSPNGQVRPAPGKTTGLALTGRWMGVVSLGLTLLGCLLIILGLATGEPNSGLETLGFLVGLLPFFLGPTAALLGIIALVRDETAATPMGRRDALVGIVSGLVTPLLCCAIAAYAGNADDDDDGDAATPRVTLVVAATSQAAGSANGETL